MHFTPCRDSMEGSKERRGKRLEEGESLCRAFRVIYFLRRLHCSAYSIPNFAIPGVVGCGRGSLKTLQECRTAAVYTEIGSHHQDSAILEAESPGWYGRKELEVAPALASRCSPATTPRDRFRFSWLEVEWGSHAGQTPRSPRQTGAGSH